MVAKSIYGGILTPPSQNFSSVRDGRNSQIFYIDIALDNARSSALATALPLNISGNSVFIDANPSDGSAVIHFQDTSFDSSSTPVYCSPGSIFNIPFTQVLIENIAQPGKKIRIIYGIDADFQPASISQQTISGSLGTIEAVYSKAALGQAFVLAGGNAAIAGQISRSILWNPIGSGKFLYVDSIAYAPAAAANMMTQTCTALGNSTQGTFGQNKYIGGPPSVASHQFNNAVASTATLIAQSFDGQQFTAAGYEDVKSNSPFVIPPGFGLAVSPNVVNTAFLCYFRYTENSTN